MQFFMDAMVNLQCFKLSGALGSKDSENAHRNGRSDKSYVIWGSYKLDCRNDRMLSRIRDHRNISHIVFQRPHIMAPIPC